MTAVVTGEAVRAVLLAAGYPEYARGQAGGFHLGEGEVEVVLEYGHGPGDPREYDLSVRQDRAELARYDQTLTAAGYRVDRAWRTHGDRMIVIRKARRRAVSGASYPVLYAPGGELIGAASTEAGAVRCASGISRLACERMTARLAERWADDGESFTPAGLAWFVGPQLVQDRRRR